MRPVNTYISLKKPNNHLYTVEYNQRINVGCDYLIVDEKDYDEFFRKRLSELRIQKHVSAREMSLALGQGHGYINKIENGKGMPSMSVFFYICQYLDITPEEFFDDKKKAPNQLSSLMKNLKAIDGEQIEHLTAFIQGFTKGVTG